MDETAHKEQDAQEVHNTQEAFLNPVVSKEDAEREMTPEELSEMVEAGKQLAEKMAGSYQSLTTAGKQVADIILANQAAMQRITEALKPPVGLLDQMIKNLTESLNMGQYIGEATRAAMQGLLSTAYMDTASLAVDMVNSVVDSESWAALRAAQKNWVERKSDVISFADELKKLDPALEPLAPYLQVEYEELKKNPEGENVTIQDLVAATDPEINPNPDTPLAQAVFRAMLHFAESQKVEIAAVALKELPQLTANTPKNHVMPNNALMNIMQAKAAINAGPFDLKVIPAKGKTPEVTAYTVLTYNPDDSEFPLPIKLTEYERQISDCLCSLWESGNPDHLFTPDMVYRAMTGTTGDPSKQQEAAIDGVINKFLHTWVEVDATEEMKARRATIDGKPVESFKLKGYYLPAQVVKAKAGGKEVTCYKMLGSPPILQYCKMTGQLLTLNPILLDVKQLDKAGKPKTVSIANSETRIALKGNLLRRIQRMKYAVEHRKKAVKTISFETLFAETGTDTASRDTKMKNRDYCADCLKFWQSIGYIKGYTMTKKGRTITGIEVEI